MSLSLRLAWRNLWRHKRRTWLTVVAMIFSNVLLVFLISIQFGSYQMMIDNTLAAFSGHLQVQHVGYNENPKIRSSIPAILPLSEQLRKDLPHARIGARASAFALVSSEKRSLGIQVVGVQPDYETGISTLPGLIKQGRFLGDMNTAEIIIGSVLARNLKVSLGDELTLLGSGMDGSFAAGVVTISGIFDTGSNDLDRSLAEIPLGYFQETFAMRDQGHAVVIAVDGLDKVDAALAITAQKIRQDTELVVLDWDQLQPGLRQAIQADMTSAILIILVAFSVLNTQLMSVLERTREFGVITALGVKPRKLASLVMLEAVLMALIGFVIGLALGWMLAYYLSINGFSYPGMEQMVEKFNLPGVIYPSVSPLAMLLGPGLVFLFCILASIYPALRLFRLQPVEAMRAV